MIHRAELDYRQTRVCKIFGVIFSLLITIPVVAQEQNASSRIVEVRALGAKCDDSNDDTAAIQSALDALQAIGGGILLIPPNTTCLAAGLVVASNVEIKGAGSASIVKAPANSTAPSIFTNIDGRRGNSVGSDISFRDLTIDGNRTSAPGSYVRGIDITGWKVETGTNIDISRVNFRSFRLHAVYVHPGAASAPYPHNIRIEDSDFGDMVQSCVYIVDANDIEISHNTFSDWDVTGTGKYDCIAGWTDQDTYGLKITDNTFLNTRGTLFAIENVPSEFGKHFYDVDISRNYFDGGNRNGGSGLSMTGTNFNIKDNLWVNGGGTWRNGVEVSGSHIHITNNLLQGGQIILSGTRYGNSGDAVLKGNQVFNRNQSNTACFQFAGVSRVRLANNYCDLSGSTGSSVGYKMGVYGTKGKLTDVELVGNIAVANNITLNQGFRLTAAHGSKRIRLEHNRAVGFQFGYRDEPDANHDEVTIYRNDFCGNAIPLQHNATGGHYDIRDNTTADYRCASQNQKTVRPL